MAESRFVYVTYIRAAPERIFAALTDEEQNRLFWSGYAQKSSWNVGAPYEIAGKDGKVWDSGKVVAFDPPRRIEVTWAHQVNEEMKAEGESLCTIELDPVNPKVTKLTLTHVIDRSPSRFIDGVASGWPSILASLKSLLETGEALEAA